MEMRLRIIWLGLKWRGKCILPVKNPHNIPVWKAQRNILTQKKREKKPQKTSICLKKQRKNYNYSTLEHQQYPKQEYTTLIEPAITAQWEKNVFQYWQLMTQNSFLLAMFLFCFFRIVWNSLCYMSQLQKLYGT